MLVLTRKRHQMIRIGKDIFVKVLRTGPSTVKIGIEAPKHVRVLRAELCQESLLVKRGESIDLDLDPGDAQPACSDQFPHPCVA